MAIGGEVGKPNLRPPVPSQQGMKITHSVEAPFADIAFEVDFITVRGGIQVNHHDPVNHPSHYISAGGIETIDVIEAWDLGYHLGNTVKYVSRAGKKGDALEDLRKARWYLDRYITKLGG